MVSLHRFNLTSAIARYTTVPVCSTCCSSRDDGEGCGDCRVEDCDDAGLIVDIEPLCESTLRRCMTRLHDAYVTADGKHVCDDCALEMSCDGDDDDDVARAEARMRAMRTVPGAVS